MKRSQFYNFLESVRTLALIGLISLVIIFIILNGANIGYTLYNSKNLKDPTLATIVALLNYYGLFIYVLWIFVKENRIAHLLILFFLSLVFGVWAWLNTPIQHFRDNDRKYWDKRFQQLSLHFKLNNEIGLKVRAFVRFP